MGGSNGMFDPGNVNVAAPYFISGRTGVLPNTITAGQAIARLAQIGMLAKGAGVNGADLIAPTPIRVSQMRVKIAPQAAVPSGGFIFEIFKGAGTPATTGGNAHAPQRRKTTGYPTIALTETHLYVAGTANITGGTFTPDDATGPIDWAMSGINDVGPGAGVWVPYDLCGTSLEAGEALEVRTAINLATTAILGIAFDFLR